MNLKSTVAGRGSREDKTYVKLDETLVSAAIPYVHVVRVHAVSLCACASASAAVRRARDRLKAARTVCGGKQRDKSG